MPTRLLFSNVPVDCSDDFLKTWIENHGYPVASVRVIPDVVSRTSPSFAHVHLTAASKLDEAERTLNGQMMNGRLVRVTQVAPPGTALDHKASA